ncbi:MAG: hypothetical protein PHE09_14210 [Oscillospiraceae bacterium]|nr:hypothetical protein [Oscillospiraceae bacterium]
MINRNNSNDNMAKFGSAFPDGRLTMPSNPIKYDFKKAVTEVKRLGRPLSEKEFSCFIKK